MESYKIKRSYELLNQDDVVAAFDIVGFHVRSVTRYRTGNVQIFNPVVYRNAIGAIPLQVFLTTRRAPGHRAYMDELFRKLNFEDLVTYLNLTYGLSLIDTLWIRPKGSEISWSDVNLFDNRFSEGIARYALTGSGLEGLQFDRPSPEFTTDGALPKAWTRDKNGVIYLRKSSTAYLGFRNAGYEPYAEYYAMPFN